MSPEERQLLTALFERIRSASSTPRDHDAETLIDEQTRQQPYATYYLAQAVIVQEKGLEAAAQRIQQLEARVQELEQALENNPQDSGQRQSGGGFLGSIFGSNEPPRQNAGTSGPWSGNSRDRIPVPNRAYDDRAPQQGGGPWGSATGQSPVGQSFGNQSFGGQPYAPSAGGSFLRGALGTAAGVAGGMLLANSLSGIFGSHTAGLGLGSPEQEAKADAAPVEETTINNYYGDNADGKATNASDTADDNSDNGYQQADYDDADTGNDDFGNDDFGGDDNFDV